MTELTSGATAYRTARIAGIAYVLCIVTGIAGEVLDTHGMDRAGTVFGFLGTACYVAVTLLFFAIFKAVSRSLAFVATAFSLGGCVVSLLHIFNLARSPISDLAFFGVYCLLLSYLIFMSSFLPRVLGPLLAIAGIGWLGFVWPPLAHHLMPWVMVTGLIGEGSLTGWMAVKGVDPARWQEQNARTVGRRSA